MVDDTKIPFQKLKHQVAQWSTYSTNEIETQYLIVIFGCSTDGNVSYLHMEDQMSQLTFQHFLKKRNRMSGKTVQRSRKIASKLVHIEQVIGLAKHIIFPPLL